MARLIAIDGTSLSGAMLRAALALSAATRQGFELTKVRSGRVRRGLRAEDLDVIRATGLVSGARTPGAFDGSPDFRFEPEDVKPGEYLFEISGPASGLLETVLPVLSTGQTKSQVDVLGGTHVAGSPSHEYLARHWAETLGVLGFGVRVELRRVGFSPAGSPGESRGFAEPLQRGGAPVDLQVRGPLVRVGGVAGVGKLPVDLAQRLGDAARSRLWEARRFEAPIEVVSLPAASPGSFLFLEAVFEKGRGAFAFLGEKRLSPERTGDRAARTLLGFIDGEGAVDAALCEQILVPLALTGRGGRVTTDAVTPSLQAVAGLLPLFGIPAKTFGRRGGPGGVEVDRC